MAIAIDPIWNDHNPICPIHGKPAVLGTSGSYFCECEDATARTSLLIDAATKPIRHMTQFDIDFDVPSEQDIVEPDKDGDGLMWGNRLDFAWFDGVQICFPAGIDKDKVVRALHKVLELVEAESDWSKLTYEDESTVYGNEASLSGASEALRDAAQRLDEHAAILKQAQERAGSFSLPF